MQKIFFYFKPLIILLGLFWSMSFFSCVGKNEAAASVHVLHYNQPQHISSLDPAFARSQNNQWAVHHIFNTLVQLDSDLRLEAGLAKSWSISPDGLRYTFILRSEVLFHEDPCFATGEARRMTASDVQFSFERLIDKTLNAPGSWVFKGKVDEEEPFKAIDDTTFVLQLKKPFLPMLNMLSMQYCSIVSKTAVQKYGAKFRRQPIGTGPFKFKRWVDQQGLYLVKNDSYYEPGLPLLDGIRTSFMQDRKIAFLELLNQKVEAVSGLESSFINELLDKEGKLLDKQADKIQFFKSPYLNFEYLGFNMEALDKNPALQDKQVRQALNYAIDRETMMLSLRNNIGQPADSGVIPKGLPSYDAQKVPGYNFDLERARSLLTAAGYSRGTGIDPIEIYTNKDYLDITTFVAKQWERLGIRVQIRLMESASLRAAMRKGDISCFRASWIADYPDGENFLSLFYSKNGAPPRYTRFVNKEFDGLYESAIQETSLEKRTALYHRMNAIIVEEAPVIFLFYDESALFFTKNIQGVETNGLNMLQVKQLKETDE